MACTRITRGSASWRGTSGRGCGRSSTRLTRRQAVAKFKGCLTLPTDFSFNGLNDMAIPATQIRRGMVIVFEGEPCRVVEFRHHTPGNLRAMVQAKLKNLRTGSGFEHRFRAADSIEPASMETHDLEFLYQGGDTYHFMNTENYDQLEMDEEMLGDNAQWMQPGMKIQAE